MLLFFNVRILNAQELEV